MKDNQQILKEEMDKIVDEITQLYIQSNKKVSGNFAEELEVRSFPNKAELFGVTYLAGRGPGKMPPVQNILNWVEARGIQPILRSMSTTSLAWAIAIKIKNEGTNIDNTLKVYEEILTPERIQKVLDKVVEFNVQNFVSQITAELRVLAQNV